MTMRELNDRPNTVRPFRGRQRWLAGILFGCLLPVALCHPETAMRLEALSERLVSVAWHMPTVARLVRKRLLQLMRVRWRYCLPLRSEQQRHYVAPRVAMSAGGDVLSRRGPPK